MDEEVSKALLKAAARVAAELPPDTDCVVIMRRGVNVFMTSSIEDDRADLVGLLWTATEKLRHGLEGRVVKVPKGGT